MVYDESAITTLKKVLLRISPDSKDEMCRIGAQIRDAKQQVVTKYGEVFSHENVGSLTRQDFCDFLLFKNNQHWGSLFRQKNQMTADMEQLRKAVSLLVDESISIKERLDILRPVSADPMVSGLGRAVITAILHVVYPDRYGVLNGTAEAGMKLLGVWPEFPRGSTFGDKYAIVNSVLLEIASEMQIDLWTLDMLWWRVIIPDKEVSGETRESPLENSIEVISEVAGMFGLERHLHEFLVDNWEIVVSLSDWSLHEIDGEVVGSRYNTGEVGEIDLLAKHKREKKWLVVELKRDQTSDTTVGQILRYMGWVRRNLAAPDESVEGIVICRQIDRKLLYALDEQPNISCMTYEVSFSLHDAPDL